MKDKELKYTQSIYGILAILSMGPQSGYEIRKALDQPEMYYWRESYGNIYPMLKKLYQDGLIDKVDSYVKKKKRLIYNLNSNGWAEFQKWLEKPADLNRFRVELLMKLRFGASSSVENMISLITHYRNESFDQLNEAEKLLEDFDSLENTLVNDLRKITINLFTERKKSTLVWCDDSEEILRKWEALEIEDDTARENSSAATVHTNMESPDRTIAIPHTQRIIPLME